MSKKSFIIRVVGILALVFTLMVIIVVLEPDRKAEGLTRARAAKAAALLLDSREAIQEYENEAGTSHFSQKEQNNWYVPYMDYLYDKGILSEELTAPTAQAAQQELTYEEADYIAGAISKRLASSAGMVQRNRKDAYPEEDWWTLYDQMVDAVGDPDGVQTLDVLLYGTPSNIRPSESWTAYTSEGDFRFEGLALDQYIDCEIRIMVRQDEMIAVRELVSEDIVYENVWLDASEGGVFEVHLGSVIRTFSSEGVKDAESFQNHLVDLEVNQGELVKISLKTDTISGKVLAVKEDSIEIEGYGEIPLDRNFRVYKVYGEFEEQDLSDILVGYDLQEFVTAKGKLCAALTTREFDAKRIRVLLMTTGFQSVFHPSVTLTFQGDAVITYGETGEKQDEIGSGESLTIEPGSRYLKDGRMAVTPKEESGSIQITSISRSQGTPAYSGTLEIKEEEGGLTLVNDLYLEDYLKKVVPSEMPGSYELEALKAQAVCARTYAYRQILGNSYSQYGAHVDDSTSFQVYNNTEESARASEAVNATYGQMMFYSGRAIEAFYFSTSCGHTTDGSAWGTDGSSTPYLKAAELRDRKETLNLSSNEAFSEFIKNKDYPAYDQSYPMYRWEAEITAEELTARVSGIGTVTNLEVNERGPGGIAKLVTISGTDGSRELNGQTEIRNVLGSSDMEITRKDGQTQSGFSILPSAYIAIEPRTGPDGVLRFHIYGGGYGHGVGMSQNGAQGMAKEGKDYKDILEFFYEGVEIREAAE